MATYSCRKRGTVMFSELVAQPHSSHTECEARCSAEPKCARYFVTRDEEDIRGSCFLFDDGRGSIAHELNQDPAAQERWCEKAPTRRRSHPPSSAAAHHPPPAPTAGKNDEIRPHRPSEPPRPWGKVAGLVVVGIFAVLLLVFLLRRFLM